jgi:hypothetical protein
MSDLTLSSDGGLQSEQWFAKPSVDLLFYRINRRPIYADPSFFDPDPDLLGHLRKVLDYAEPGYSGRKNRREWRLGSLRFDAGRGIFTGRLGWARSAAALGQAWDAQSHEWIERVVPREDSAVAPVAFAAQGRILGVLKHPSFGTTERVLHEVISQILNSGEQHEDVPTTVWHVEPLGDTGQFYAWLDGVDQLMLLRLVFERPNPDGEEEFEKLFDRLDRYQAEQITEEIRARDRNVGLQKDEVRKDPTTQGFLSAALDHAFGRIWARGVRGGRQTVYDQRAKVLRQSIDFVGVDWETASNSVLEAVESRSKKQVTDGKHPKGSGVLDSGRPTEAE